MKLKLQRYSDNGNSTLGLLFIDNEFECYTLEDEFREVKISGETRIPKGIYDRGIRNELTPLTLKYQKKYEWFEKHIEILNVPNFHSIYIHIGNFETHTAGCLLLGNSVNNNKIQRAFYSF